MTATCSESVVYKAAKRHRCDWCWQFVEPGELYRRYRLWDGGEASTVKMHTECHDAMQADALAEGGWIEWTPGQERPTPKDTPTAPKGS